MIVYSKILEIFYILLWITAWFLGGFLIVINAYKIRRHEATILGFGVGLLLQVWVANWLSRLLEPVLAFWCSAIFILFVGILVTLIFKNQKMVWKSIHIPLNYWIPFVVFLVIFFMIGRGLAIFDDYQNLPVTSYIASGAVPPKFVLNPALSFDYHYLMLLNSAQWMRIADLFPWTALDFTRAIFFGLTLIYSAFLGRRITSSLVAGWLSAFFVAFAGGIRWVLLFLPENLINTLSRNISLMGSGLGTAENLKKALIINWAVEGDGPIPFPFAFGNGYHTISVMEHDGTGLMGTVIALLIILLFQKWKNNLGLIVMSILIAAMALIDEVWFVFFVFAAILFFIILLFQNRERNWKQLVFPAIYLIIIPSLFSLIQGGVISGVFNGVIQKFSGNLISDTEQYYSMNFPFRWPPALISAHLGVLYLTRGSHLIGALAEVGPIIFLIPLFMIWCWKAYQQKYYIYSILGIGCLLSLFMVFVEYQGSAGISASKRLTLFSTDLLIIFAIPLLWLWIRKRTNGFQLIGLMFVIVIVLGGLVNFSIEAISIQEPVLSYFIDPLDAEIQEKYWNVLGEDVMVFDKEPSRSATIFARPTKSNLTWYKHTTEYLKLSNNPQPEKLLQGGYQFVYWSKSDWENLTEESRKSFDQSCVNKIYEVSNSNGDFRWLLDISACKK